MAKKKKESEERGRTVVEIGWSDCFKFWGVGIILMWLSIIVITIVYYATLP